MLVEEEKGSIEVIRLYQIYDFKIGNHNVKHRKSLQIFQGCVFQCLPLSRVRCHLVHSTSVSFAHAKVVRLALTVLSPVEVRIPLESKRTSFANAELVWTPFSDAKLVGTSFPNAKLVWASFANSELVWTPFSDPKLIRTSFSDPKFVGASFFDVIHRLKEVILCQYFLEKWMNVSTLLHKN